MNNILAPLFYPNLLSIIRHRDAYNSATENTLIAFQKAAQLGAGCVEIDVRLSSNKVPVIFHDNEVNRTTTGQGSVGGFTLKSLKQLDAGSNYHTDFSGRKIPTLLETINLCIELNLGMNIEIKPNYGQAAETVTIVLAIINRFQEHLKGNVLFSSFDFLCLEALINFSPEWPRALLVNDLNNDWLANTKALECYGLTPNYNCLTSIESIKSVLDSGLRIIPFTVNQLSTANKLLRSGFNSIITDDLESLNLLQNYKM